MRKLSTGNKSSVVGLDIGKDYVRAAKYIWQDGWQKSWSNVESLSIDLFGQKMLSDSAQRELAQVIQAVAVDAIKKNELVNVTIPDPAVHCSLFEQKSIPRLYADQIELCRSRFAKQGNDEAYSMEISFQSAIGDGGLYSILAMGMEKRWLNEIQHAFVVSGLRAHGFVPSMFAQFNRYYSRLVESRCVSSMILLHQASWSLLIWDEVGRLQYCKAHWRHHENAEDVQLILEDVERITKAYARGDAKKTVQKFFVAGDSLDTELLFDLLGARLKDTGSIASPEDERKPLSSLCYLGENASEPAIAAALGLSA